VLALGALSCTRHVTVPDRPLSPRPAMVETMERQVANAVDAGDGDMGARLLRDRLAAEPDNVAVRLELAQRYRRMGFPEIALEHYRLAAEQFPGRADVHLALARELRRQRYYSEAARVLDRYLAGHPDSTGAIYSWAGIVHDELGEWKEGERAHREAMLRAAAPEAYLHNNLGQNLLLQGKPTEAAVEFRLALKLEPESAIARNNLGVALAGQPEAALQEWKSTAGTASAHSNLAAVLIEEGDYAEARRQLALALGHAGQPGVGRRVGRPAGRGPASPPGVDVEAPRRRHG
jgi:tetratricopeptide (TPR) repeat protein